MSLLLSVSITDYQGIQLGDSSAPAWVRILLCGFGANLPRVVGAQMIGQVASLPKDVPYLGAPIAIPIVGNDQITPAGTFYVITLLDPKRNIVQSAAYQLAGSGLLVLSSLTPYNPPPPSQATPNAVITNPPGSGTQIIAGGLTITGDLNVDGSSNIGFAGNSVVAPATAVTFDASAARQFQTILNQDVTESNVVNASYGPYFFEITQDVTGGHVFSWPANFFGAGTIDPTPNTTSAQCFWFDGANFVAISDMNSFIG